MTDKSEGSPSQDKPFRVRRDADGSDILASFDTLEEAIADVRRRRSDWRYLIVELWTIVWPEDRVKGSRRVRHEKPRAGRASVGILEAQGHIPSRKRRGPG